MTTVMSLTGWAGSLIFLTVPFWIPPTRTSAPSFKPETFLKVVSRRYVEEKRKLRLPIRNIPADRMASPATINTPSRKLRDMLRLAFPEKLHDEGIVTLFQILERALDQNFSLADQSQPVGHGL